jgi:DNA-binding beta-propeller fold protein YncE
MAGHRSAKYTVLALAAAVAIGTCNLASAAPLMLVRGIPIGPVAGEITDLELDYANQRLFALEADSGTIAVIDLPTGTVSQILRGLQAPRGLAHEPPNSQLYVALGDGKLAVLQGVPLRRTATVNIGSNLGRPYYDASSTQVYLGYGRRAIGVIDTAHNRTLPSIGLDGEPGPLAFENLGTRLFAGAVGEARILVADRAAGKQLGSWSTGKSSDAAALALDEDAGLLVVAFRQPAGLAWFDPTGGNLRGRTEACTEAAKLIIDSLRTRVYLTCGEGQIEIFQRGAAGNYSRIGAIDTQPGATAALLAPAGDRLYLAVPSAAGRGAEIRIYAPSG